MNKGHFKTCKSSGLRTLALVLFAVAGGGAVAHAGSVTPPAVPAALAVPAGNHAYKLGFAMGTQDYICLPGAGGTYAWTFFGPQATLLNGRDEQTMTHFLSPNPVEAGTPRATWQNSEDTSQVWGNKLAGSSDAAFVAPGAIPWLLLAVVGSQSGPTGGTNLMGTTFIQRLNTAGGVAPATGCAVDLDLGKKALVPYSAEYDFFKADKL